MSRLPITEVATTSESVLLNPVPGRRMELPGFDQEFVDFPDFIVRITDRIWHQRQVDLCREYYTDDCVIHTLAGQIVGADTVVENTHATLASFPDRRLEPDNVIWSDDGPDGFYSSHLITSPMTNLGESEFGPATGKKIRVITIADCACRENRIYEEWLVRDYAAMAIQLGCDPQKIALRQAQADAQNAFSLIEHHAPTHRQIAQLREGRMEKPGDPESSPRHFAEYMLTNIWGHADGEAYGEFYDFRAVRWTMAGMHSQDGIYGPASGAPIVIMGVTHWRIINGHIHSEVTIWDDIALRRQIESCRLSA